MSVSLTRLSWWYWSNGKEKETKLSSGSSSESINISSLGKKDSTKLTKKVKKKKWQSREMMDKEYDAVLVPSDGVCLSEEEKEEDSSYDSDWSVGWMEPHAPDFDDDDENDASFAVLVPCYKNNCKAFKMDDHDDIVANGKFSAEGNKYMEQWIASLQNF